MKRMNPKSWNKTGMTTTATARMRMRTKTKMNRQGSGENVSGVMVVEYAIYAMEVDIFPTTGHVPHVRERMASAKIAME